MGGVGGCPSAFPLVYTLHVTTQSNIRLIATLVLFKTSNILSDLNYIRFLGDIDMKTVNFATVYSSYCGRDSSVGIATRYELEGPGIESRWGRDFPHPSRPALGPTQPPVQ